MGGVHSCKTKLILPLPGISCITGSEALKWDGRPDGDECAIPS